MGFLKGTVSFTRFHVDGQLPQAFLNFVDSRIKANSFRQAAKLTEEKRLGWVSLTDVLDSDFQKADYVLGNYLIFSMRIDRKVISPKLLKVKIMEEAKRYLVETKASRINKQAASAIKEKVRMELLSKTEPVPSFYDVCWALGSNVIYFSSYSDKVVDDFADLFKKTFSLNLKRSLPPENPHILKNITEGIAFKEDTFLISREFLTWLWFKSEERNGRISLPDGGETELTFLKRIALEAGEGEYSQGVVCHGLHAELKEGKEAIRQGKKVKEAGLKLIADQNEWDFTFKADNFCFQSLKLPETDKLETENDPAGGLLERIYLIEKVCLTIDTLYDYFLTIRFSPQWKDKEINLLTRWLKLEN